MMLPVSISNELFTRNVPNCNTEVPLLKDTTEETPTGKDTNSWQQSSIANACDTPSCLIMHVKCVLRELVGKACQRSIPIWGGYCTHMYSNALASEWERAESRYCSDAMSCVEVCNLALMMTVGLHTVQHTSGHAGELTLGFCWSSDYYIWKAHYAVFLMFLQPYLTYLMHTTR